MCIELDIRHKTAVDYVSNKVRESLGDNVLKVVLYGSCARGDYHYSSDVDILVVVHSMDFNVRLLRGECISDSLDMADVDVHFVTEESYNSRTDTYMNIIRKEGVAVESV